jgi:hypothetical protein
MIPTSRTPTGKPSIVRQAALPCSLLLAVILAAGPALGQFNSGSTGASGALDCGTNGTVVFDPAGYNHATNPETGDILFNFTTITIGSGCTLRLTADALGSLGNHPVVWLASGGVQIAGTVDLSGAPGHHPDQPRVAAAPGPGGGAGGVGGTPSGLPPESGEGFGGGGAAGDCGGGGGGYAGDGGICQAHAVYGGGNGGPPYGNEFISPLLGGSGGGGGANSGCGGGGEGGGAGGGALLIASSGTINVSGAINGNGGSGGACGCYADEGGGGSGGAIRLVASGITGSGVLQANGGSVPCSGWLSAGPGSGGRIRLEAFHQQFVGSISPAAAFSTPYVVFPTENAPTVRVTTVGGIAVPTPPTASFNPPDVTIDQGGPVTLAIEAHNIPPGTPVHLRITPQSGTSLSVDSDPLTGTLASSTANATVTVPAGFSRFYVQASW